MSDRRPMDHQPDGGRGRTNRFEIEAKLVEVRRQLATVSRGTVASKDALSANRHLERLMFNRDGLPPTVAPHGIRRRG